MNQKGKDITLAASILKDGRAVGIPTETVYGLAANALDASAVLSVFEIKKPGNYYIQFDIPPSDDEKVLKKGCMYTMIGFKENE